MNGVRGQKNQKMGKSLASNPICFLTPEPPFTTVGMNSLMSLVSKEKQNALKKKKKLTELNDDEDTDDEEVMINE